MKSGTNRMADGEMLCGNAVEKLVECARRRGNPDAAVTAHLQACEPCSERWQSERRLAAHLRILRIEASTRRSSEASREALMRRFAEKHETAWGHGWLWSAAAAATFLLALFLTRDFERNPAPRPADPETSIESADMTSDSQYNGFIPVPFVPPLASGELVRVVHTELYPAALASLGVRVDPGWTTELPADLLMGQDGFPRAVRISVDSDEQGF